MHAQGVVGALLTALKQLLPEQPMLPVFFPAAQPGALRARHAPLAFLLAACAVAAAAGAADEVPFVFGGVGFGWAYLRFFQVRPGIAACPGDPPGDRSEAMSAASFLPDWAVRAVRQVRTLAAPTPPSAYADGIRPRLPSVHPLADLGLFAALPQALPSRSGSASQDSLASSVAEALDGRGQLAAPARAHEGEAAALEGRRGGAGAGSGNGLDGDAVAAAARRQESGLRALEERLAELGGAVV